MDSVWTRRKWMCWKVGQSQALSQVFAAFWVWSSSSDVFSKSFSEIAAPVTNLTKKDQGIQKWDDLCDEAFESLKKAVTSAPIFVSPDWKKYFRVTSMHLSFHFDTAWWWETRSSDFLLLQEVKSSRKRLHRKWSRVTRAHILLEAIQVLPGSSKLWNIYGQSSAEALLLQT